MKTLKETLFNVPGLKIRPSSSGILEMATLTMTEIGASGRMKP
jgi:hypothetical protein